MNLEYVSLKFSTVSDTRFQTIEITSLLEQLSRMNNEQNFCRLGSVFGARVLRDAHMVTFLGHELCEMPIWWRFFFAEFVTCANFSNLWDKYFKTQNRYGHRVFAKSCADPRLHFWRESFRKKFGFMGFFQKNFWKNAISDYFSSLIHFISELRPNTGSMIS